MNSTCKCETQYSNQIQISYLLKNTKTQPLHYLESHICFTGNKYNFVSYVGNSDTMFKKLYKLYQIKTM